MKLIERLERKVFTRLVEVFPPNFSADPSKEPVLGFKQKMRDLVERVRKIESLADGILVADVKDLTRLKTSSVFAAAVLKEEIGLETIPVLTARDMNRIAVRTLALTALSYGIESLMLVWGDRYASGDGAKNVYDYSGLFQMLGEVKSISERSGARIAIFAPVNISRLGSRQDIEVVTFRISKGADCLLAQPPTTDVSITLKEHLSILSRSDLLSRVLLNVFPFRNIEDLEQCRGRFGWSLPKELNEIAKGGEGALLREAKRVAERLQESGSAGVYVSTRGKPELARYILD